MEAAAEKVTMDVVVHKANIPLASGESLDKFVHKLSEQSRAATYKKFAMNRDTGDYAWMVEAFSDSVIMSVDKKQMPRKMFAMSYKRDGATGNFTFGDATEVERKTSFVPVSTTAAVSTAATAKSVDVEKAVWTAAYINTFPDSSFAVVSSGGKKDKEGKTVPRSLRHLPYKDANGKVDLAHLRNALSRLPQSKLSPGDMAKARRVLEAAAKAAKVGAAAKPKATAKAVEQLDVSKGQRQVFGNERSQWVQTSKSFWGGINLV